MSELHPCLQWRVAWDFGLVTKFKGDQCPRRNLYFKRKYMSNSFSLVWFLMAQEGRWKGLWGGIQVIHSLICSSVYVSHLTGPAAAHTMC